MKQENKELLLKVLCAMLCYDVKIAPVVSNCEFNTIGGYCDVLEDFYIKEVDGWFNVSMIKPYLRPMSSMTSKEWVEFCDCSLKDEASWVMTKNRQMFIPVQSREDYLNSKHFDYRGLIEKGLALEAPEDMY